MRSWLGRWAYKARGTKSAMLPAMRSTSPVPHSHSGCFAEGPALPCPTHLFLKPPLFPLTFGSAQANVSIATTCCERRWPPVPQWLPRVASFHCVHCSRPRGLGHLKKECAHANASLCSAVIKNRRTSVFPACACYLP